MKTKPEKILQQPDLGNASEGTEEQERTPVNPESFFCIIIIQHLFPDHKSILQLSSNDELKSINEELETFKEEMQSTNE